MLCQRSISPNGNTIESHPLKSVRMSGFGYDIFRVFFVTISDIYFTKDLQLQRDLFNYLDKMSEVEREKEIEREIN